MWLNQPGNMKTKMYSLSQHTDFTLPLQAMWTKGLKMVIKMYVNSFPAIFMKCESIGSALPYSSEILNRAAQDSSDCDTTNAPQTFPSHGFCHAHIVPARDKSRPNSPWILRWSEKMDVIPLWEISFLCSSQGSHTFIFPWTLSLHIFFLIPLLIPKQPYPRGPGVSSTVGINLAAYQFGPSLPLVLHQKSSFQNRSIKTSAGAIVTLIFHSREAGKSPATPGFHVK